MSLRKMTFTTRYVLVIGVLLLVVNSFLGIIIYRESKTALKGLVNKNMLDVVSSAAGTIDGDELGSLTKDDVDGPVFNKIARQLTVFSDNVDIEYIYAVKKVGRNKFVFTVDPDPEDPGEFGEDVLITDALRKAGNGKAAADDEAAADEWGNFYSAYCPVYDSHKNMAGIIGIDYAAEWYEDQISNYTVTIIIFLSLSVVIGSILVFLITYRVRKKFAELDEELSEISSGVDILMGELATYSGLEIKPAANQTPNEAGEPSDELENLSRKMHSMQSDLGQYLDYLHTQAFKDALTDVNNSSAYHEKIEEIDSKISEGTANFALVAFDLNNLKQLNDNFGHECGDVYLHGAADSIAQVFGKENTFRIGGDEFAVILESTDEESAHELLGKLKSIVDKFIDYKDNPYDEELSLAVGTASFDPETDNCFADVFGRADKKMYLDKKLYYESHDRRR